MKKLISLIAIFLFYGCASFNMFNKDLPKLKGNHIEEAFHIFGYPDYSYPIDDMTVYVWGENSIISVPTTSYNNVYGSVGDTPVYGSVTSTQSEIISAQCNMKIIAQNGIIQDFDYYGNLYGCSGYINALHKYILAKEKLSQSEKTEK